LIHGCRSQKRFKDFRLCLAILSEWGSKVSMGNLI
jgi:hypothetical protein